MYVYVCVRVCVHAEDLKKPRIQGWLRGFNQKAPRGKISPRLESCSHHVVSSQQSAMRVPCSGSNVW